MKTVPMFLSGAGPGGPWLAVGLDMAGKAALILLASGLLAIALRRASAAARHLAWSLGLAGSLALLPLSALLPRWDMPVLPEPAPAPVVEAAANPRPAEVLVEAPPTEWAASPGLIEPPPIHAPAPLAAEMSAAPASNRPARPIGWATWVVAGWAAGAIVVLAPLAVALIRTRRIARRCERIEGGPWAELAGEAADRLGIRRPIVLLRGDRETMPMTWGVLRPRVLLPGGSDDWSEERRRVVLLRELAHVRRRDCLTQAIARGACAVYWFNPLPWLAAARLRVERERACDDLVLRAGERPSTYAGHLLAIARSLRAPSGLAAAAVAMARPSQFEGRLRAILDASRRRNGPARWLATSGLVAVLCVAAVLAAVRLEAKSRAESDPDPDPPPVVSGTVLGEDGTPIEGTELVLLHSPPAPGIPADQAPAAVLGRARSDAEGRFDLEVNEHESDVEDTFTLVATAPGLGFAARELGEPSGPIDEAIRLAPEQPVEVILINLEGSPLAGAEVRLNGVYPMQGSGAVGLGGRLLTDEGLLALTPGWSSDDDGRIILRGIGPDHSIFLRIAAPGFGRQQHQLQVEEGTEVITVAMAPAHVIEGRVILGEGGPPAVGARVRAQSMSASYGTGMPMGDAETLTDEEGRYRLEAAPGQSIRTEVNPPPGGAGGVLLQGRLLVPGTEFSTRADFTLPQGVLVRGRVTEAGTGQPIAGAVVEHEAHERGNPYFIGDARAWYSGDGHKATTDADGSFRLAVVPGPGYLLVKAPTPDYLRPEITNVELHGGLIWPNRRNYPDAFLKVEPKPEDSPFDVELTVRRGATLHGRLVSSDGKPVREAILFSRWYLSPRTMDHNGASTKPIRGDRFELGGCDPDSSAPVFFLDAKNQRGAVVELAGSQAGEDLEVTLQPCGSATVRFVDDEGRPIAGRNPGTLFIVLTPGVSFSESHRVDGESPITADEFIVSNIDRDRHFQLKTDADGRITFPTLIPGATYRVSVFNQPEPTEIEFTVRPGEAKDLGEMIILQPESAG